MASNPSRPYGVGLLDDIHTLFPELLYDTHFNNDIIQLVRGRVEFLYNDVYTRSRSRWAGIREANFNTWRQQQIPRQPQNNYIASNIIQTPITPVRITPIQTVPPAPVRRTRTTYTTATDNAIISLLTSAASRSAETMPMMDFMDLMLRPETMPNTYDDVPIIPTAAEINNGSQLVTVVPSDALCTICQEHGNGTPTWRQLNCSHRFHNDCILPWFERNSQCPVCRADLRTMAAIASALSSSTTRAGAENLNPSAQ